MLLHVTPQAHLHLARNLSEPAKAMIHQVWPQTMQLHTVSYLVDVPEDLGREIGEQLNQPDADMLVGLWPELNYLLEAPAGSVSA